MDGVLTSTVALKKALAVLSALHCVDQLIPKPVVVDELPTSEPGLLQLAKVVFPMGVASEGNGKQRNADENGA